MVCTEYRILVDGYAQIVNQLLASLDVSMRVREGGRVWMQLGSKLLMYVCLSVL